MSVAGREGRRWGWLLLAGRGCGRDGYRLLAGAAAAIVIVYWQQRIGYCAHGGAGYNWNTVRTAYHTKSSGTASRPCAHGCAWLARPWQQKLTGSRGRGIQTASHPCAIECESPDHSCERRWLHNQAPGRTLVVVWRQVRLRGLREAQWQQRHHFYL